MQLKNKKMKKNTIIFDLDGTLLDTLQDLADAANASAEYLGFSKRSIEEIRQFVGTGVGNLLKKTLFEKDGELVGFDEEIFQKSFDFFVEFYGKHGHEHTCTYNGTDKMLETLKNNGFKMAIVSNKLDAAVKELNAHFFEKYVELAMGEQEGMRRKPEPDLVFAAIRQLGSTPEEAIYIGDSEVDIKTAANAGLPCISVLWGFRSRDELLKAGAKTFAEKPEDIPEIVSQIK